MYGSADNSAFGGEALAGIGSTEDLEVQWLGLPGPRHQSERHNPKPAPLAAAGRLFIQGLRRILALDAYNGLPLWSLEIPELRRFNIPRSSANWCADEDALYVALGKQALTLSADRGEILRRFEISQDQDAEHEWGYIARTAAGLLGSAVKAGSQFVEFFGPSRWYDAKDGDGAAKVCSDRLFCLDPVSGERRWEYRGGLILNPTITVHQDRIYFVESHDAASASLPTGRIPLASLWNRLDLVALEASTGTEQWRREARPMAGKVAFYLAASDGHLVLMSSADGEFALYVLRCSDGQSLWRKKFAWEVDHHGKHLSRPAIVGGKIYVRPLVFKLASGQQVEQPFPEGHQCGTYTASESALFLRAGPLSVWDVRSGESSSWQRLRPDCWISTIPACGLLLAPEGGGGCSCGSWMEVSMAFLPKAQ
jgi:outer membrane protein assembly factor BamB